MLTNENKSESCFTINTVLDLTITSDLPGC